MPPIDDLESKIEALLVKKVKEAGGYCYKWSSPSNRGVPDRIVFLNKQIWFVELKTKRGKLSKLQVLVGNIIQKFTDNYCIIRSRMEVIAFVEKVKGLEATNLESVVERLQEELSISEEQRELLKHRVDELSKELFDSKATVLQLKAKLKAKFKEEI